MLLSKSFATKTIPFLLPPPPLSCQETSPLSLISRRRLLLTSSISFTISPFLNPFLLSLSQARGLFQMPPIRLTNRKTIEVDYGNLNKNVLSTVRVCVELDVSQPLTDSLVCFKGESLDTIAESIWLEVGAMVTYRYFLVRAGESEYENLGIINTNPVAKTSVDNGLSENGKKQTVKAALALKAIGACEGSCWIWPSITQRAYQAAEIIAAANGITRSYIVPEYSFLDARGLGAYEGKTLSSISEVYASDTISANIKPPPIDDGTPNESVSDVFVRVTQLMSILETQYSGDTIIIVSPDSDNLSILQAGLVGLDLKRHNELSFAPGEVRFVDASSIPTYKQPASAVYKCLNPPNCN